MTHNAKAVCEWYEAVKSVSTEHNYDENVFMLTYNIVIVSIKVHDLL